MPPNFLYKETIVRLHVKEGTCMNIGHLKIEKDGLDNYIVNNTFNNKFVKLGIREVRYLLEKLEGTTDLEGEKDYPPLSKGQKKLLDEKFKEWGFFEKAKLNKTKKNKKVKSKK